MVDMPRLEDHPELDTIQKQAEFLSKSAAQVVAVEGERAFPKCPFCEHYLFYLETDRAWTKGHVYSSMGLKELRITGMCEWCFDTSTLDRDEDAELYEHYKALGGVK